MSKSDQTDIDHKPVKYPRGGIISFNEETILEKLVRVLTIVFIIVLPILLLFCFRAIKQYKRAVILRFGRIRSDSPAGPGIIWVNPFTDNVALIDIRSQSFNLPPQQILTKDSVTVTVDAVVYFHVLKPVSCLLNVQYYRIATELITIAILRTILGQHTLTEALKSRESISLETRLEIDKVTIEWGVEIERVEIKDILLPFELQKAMAAEAEGTRIAKAKLIEAAGEIKTAENLSEASRIIVENPQIMLLRYLQTLNNIASGQNSTILFPFPVEMPELFS